MDARSPSPDAPLTSAVLRPARAEDVAAVVAIERASFSDPWPERSFADSVSDPALTFLVAAEAGVVVGYVIAWFVAEHGEIANIAVAPEARGRGLGGTLLDAALAEGRARGALATFLEVRESNACARALYASRAFTEIGRRRGYYRRPPEDAIVLRREEAAVRRD